MQSAMEVTPIRGGQTTLVTIVTHLLDSTDCEAIFSQAKKNHGLPLWSLFFIHFNISASKAYQEKNMLIMQSIK